MRAYEILLEYNRQLTLRNYGPKLLSVLSDTSNVDNDRYYRGPKLLGMSDTEILDTVISMIENSDPSPNKQYVQYIIREYIKRNIDRLEDLSTVTDLLSKYSMYRKDRLFDPKYLDIMKTDYKTLANYIFNFKTGKYEEGKYSIVYDDSDMFIVQLGDLLSSKYWANYGGVEAIWCTRYPGNFKYYTDMGPLYVIINKSNPVDKYQIHFPTVQLKDRHDDDVEYNDLAYRYSGIKKYFSSIFQDYDELIITQHTDVLMNLWDTIEEIVTEKIDGLALSNSYNDDDFKKYVDNHYNKARFKDPEYRLEKYKDFKPEGYERLRQIYDKVQSKSDILYEVEQYRVHDYGQTYLNSQSHDNNDMTVSILPSVYSHTIRGSRLTHWVNTHVGIVSSEYASKNSLHYYHTIKVGKYTVYYDEDLNKIYSYYM